MWIFADVEGYGELSTVGRKNRRIDSIEIGSLGGIESDRFKKVTWAD